MVVEALLFRDFGADGELSVVAISPIKYSLAPTLLIAEIRTLYVVPGAKPVTFKDFEMDLDLGTVTQVFPSREVSTL